MIANRLLQDHTADKTIKLAQLPNTLRKCVRWYKQIQSEGL